MNINHLSELRKAVQEFQDNYPQLSPDNAFVAWFLRAFIVGSDEEAMKALTGGARDKGIDAVYIDDSTKTVSVLQGKYHQRLGTFNEKRSDIIALGQIGEVLLSDNRNKFDALLADADVIVQDILKEARKAIKRNDYRLILQFVTTGKISDTHKREAEQLIEDYPRASFETCSYKNLLRRIQDYLEGVAPPVPTINIPIHRAELFGLYDENTEISSWIFAVQGHEIAKIFKDVGIRLFARNIRGFLGNTAINREIEETLKHEPEFFWYFNNGITFICDEARQISERGKTYLRANNAQVINGQQTTRVLADVRNNKKAMVVVKLIELPRETEEAHSYYTKIIGKIVRATNRQNTIKASDLKSNDTEQVRIERELRKLKYQYIRKRQTKQEARRAAGMRYSFMINKEELAQRAAACLLGPYEVRLGKDRLFEDDFYPKLFNENRLIFEYLLYYWLGRMVSRFTNKDIRRGYGKWLVMRYIWREIGKELKKSIIREKFLHIIEHEQKYKKELKPFYQMINEVFKASVAFYEENKRIDKGVVSDPSLFFKRANLYNRFKSFLRKEKKRSDKIKVLNVRFLRCLKTLES